MPATRSATSTKREIRPSILVRRSQRASNSEYLRHKKNRHSPGIDSHRSDYAGISCNSSVASCQFEIAGTYYSEWAAEQNCKLNFSEGCRGDDNITFKSSDTRSDGKFSYRRFQSPRHSPKPNIQQRRIDQASQTDGGRLQEAL